MCPGSISWMDAVQALPAVDCDEVTNGERCPPYKCPKGIHMIIFIIYIQTIST